MNLIELARHDKRQSSVFGPEHERELREREYRAREERNRRIANLEKAAQRYRVSYTIPCWSEECWES